MKNMLHLIAVIVFVCVSHAAQAQVPIVDAELPELIKRYVLAEESEGELFNVRATWEDLRREPSLISYMKLNHPNYHEMFKLRGFKYDAEKLQEKYKNVDGDVTDDFFDDDYVDDAVDTPRSPTEDEAPPQTNRDNVLDSPNQARTPNTVTPGLDDNRTLAIQSPNKVTFSNSERAKESPNKVTRSNNELMNDARRRQNQSP